MKTEYDVIVVGGGFAGFAAACAAAREGAETLLIEKNGCLGGAAADSLVMPFMRYYTRGNNQTVNAGLFKEACDRMGVNGLYFCEEDMKPALEQLCLEHGVHLLYHTTVTEVKQTGNQITGLTAFSVGKKFELTAKVFVDATGDGNIAAMAGCGFELGENGTCQPMTLCFRMCNVDTALFRREHVEKEGKMQALYLADKEAGLIQNPRENVLLFFSPVNGVIHFNTTRIIDVDPTDPVELTRAEIQARGQVAQMAAFMKRHFKITVIASARSNEDQ